MLKSPVYTQLPRAISTFLGIPFEETVRRLSEGFPHHHRLATEEFLARVPEPRDLESLLEWYRTTDAYIWGLGARHLAYDYQFVHTNKTLLSLCGEPRRTVLFLGDAIGTLSMLSKERGLYPIYHDLAGSRTAEFAQHRFTQLGMQIPTYLTDGWNPTFTIKADVVLAHSFFEHLPNIDDWLSALAPVLEVDGLLIARNDWFDGWEQAMADHGFIGIDTLELVPGSPEGGLVEVWRLANR